MVCADVADFCLNITCETIFILYFKINILRLSLGVNKGFHFEEGKKYSHLEVGAYCACFEVLARAMIIQTNFVALNLMLKKQKQQKNSWFILKTCV